MKKLYRIWPFLAHPARAQTLDFAGSANTFVGSNHCLRASIFFKICSKFLPKWAPNSMQNQSKNRLMFHRFFDRFCHPKIIQNGSQNGMKETMKNSTVGSQVANWGQEEPTMAPRRPPELPKWPQDIQTAAPRLPKWSSWTLGTPKMEPWRAPENQKCIHSASKQHPKLKLSWNLKLAQVFINIATTIIKLCDPLLPMFASTLLRPPILSAKMSACPFVRNVMVVAFFPGLVKKWSADEPQTV